MLNDITIKIENAVVSYREDFALRGVSLQVMSGEFLSIIGPNGAGKTSLLTIINGLTKLVRGKVTVLGQSVTPGNAHSLRKRIGYVAQLPNIDPRTPLNVREVAMIGRFGRLGWLKRPQSHDWQVVDRMLDMVGLSGLSRRPIGHLSGGEQQRVAIARCLVQEPELFLLDEPAASLDWKAKTDILELVKRIHDSRKLTTIFVTHDLSALPATCERVVLMKEGLIWAEGPPEKMLTDETLGQLYDVPLSIVKSRRVENLS